METYKEIVDRAVNTIKSYGKDSRVSKRYILKVFLDKLEFFISQKLSDRSLFKETDLYTTIECLELESVDVYTCDVVEFRSCNKVMRSVKELPQVVSSRYGLAIKDVTNIDNSIEYKATTPSEYRRNKIREGKDPNQRYYTKDRRLYLPDSSTELVNLSILTLESYKANESSSCNKNSCKSYWEYSLPTSSKINEIAYQETLKELGFSLQIPKDENPNLNSNQK